jgi:hypothetical protein
MAVSTKSDTTRLSHQKAPQERSKRALLKCRASGCGENSIGIAWLRISGYLAPLDRCQGVVDQLQALRLRWLRTNGRFSSSYCKAPMAGCCPTSPRRTLPWRASARPSNGFARILPNRIRKRDPVQPRLCAGVQAAARAGHGADFGGEQGGSRHKICGLSGPLGRAGLLWRAGLPRVGLRSSPIKDAEFTHTALGRQVLGLLRNPTRGKPARHGKPACHRYCYLRAASHDLSRSL